MNEKKNALFERDIRHNVQSKMYVDEDASIPLKKMNPPFFQFYKGASFDYLKEKMTQNPKAMAVWFELVSLMDNQGAVMISQPSLAEFFNVSLPTIKRFTKWLDDNDMISIFKVGTANVYAINASIVSDRLVTEKQHFTLFNARVVAEKKEQTKKIKNKFFSVADVQNVHSTTLKQFNIFGGVDDVQIQQNSPEL